MQLSSSRQVPTHTGPDSTFVIMMAITVALWFTAIVTAGAHGAFHAQPPQPPVATLLAIGFPPALFLLLLRSPGVKEQILTINPVWLAAVHGLRILGAGFLFVYAYGHLSGVFANPAGWGDILVAVLAPFVAARLAGDPAFLRSKWLWRFHVLGMIDFVGAVGSGLLFSGDASVSPTGVLGEFPLLLIPTFAVPLWICLHIAAFAQIAEARRRETPR